MDAWGDDLWKAAYSMLPQSSVVYSLNQGMVRIYNDSWLCGAQECNIDILAQVHDSILLQVPLPVMQDIEKFTEVGIQVYKYVSPNMTYNGRTFQIATDSKVGLNWGGYNKATNPLGMRDVKDLTTVPSILGELNV